MSQDVTHMSQQSKIWTVDVGRGGSKLVLKFWYTPSRKQIQFLSFRPLTLVFAMDLIEDNDKILASLSTSIALVIRRMNAKPKRGGSTMGRQEIYCNRLQGDHMLYNDCFSKNPTCLDYLFRRRFRMQRPLYLKIVEAVSQEDDYFIQKRDATGRLGFLPLQKITAAFRLLAYGCRADSINKYLRISQYFNCFQIFFL
jgi:hypothetical protein